MRLAMDLKTYLNFYKSTTLGYSKNLQNHICRLLEAEKRITFEAQRNITDDQDTLYIDFKKDHKAIITRTTTDVKFIDFYEKWEFIKLYKYSVPLFYEVDNDKSVKKLLDEKGIKRFEAKGFEPEYILNTSLKETTPIYWEKEQDIYIKFVLQKAYFLPDTFEQIDYRFPVVVYVNPKNKVLEIRYDSTRYDSQFDNEAYEKLVLDCVGWLETELGIELFLCEHMDIIGIINDSQNETVKIYKQMMQMSSGGSAELTASESADYVLPFIGEIRGLIDDNEELFSQAEDVRQLLLQYLSDKEATASYPYIYVKWVKPVETQSYTVKVTFDYLSHRFTLLQHITGNCKDLGMERMNDAIKYLCESRAFVKGEKI